MSSNDPMDELLTCQRVISDVSPKAPLPERQSKRPAIAAPAEVEPAHTCDHTSSLEERLEIILSKLDIKTLLFAHQVCKQWVAVISSSPTLQRQLFMLADGPGRAFYLAPTEDKWPDVEDHDPCENGWMQFDDRHEWVKPTFNALLIGLSCDQAPPNYCLRNEFQRLCRGLGEPSWHKMFLMRPPAKHLLLRCPAKDGSKDSFIRVDREDGIRMVDIKRGVCKLFESNAYEQGMYFQVRTKFHSSLLSGRDVNYDEELASA